MDLQAAFDQYTQEDVRKKTPLNILFKLTEQDAISCHQALRIIPGKRMVCTGTWGALPVIIKLYFDPQKARRHWQTSHAGASAFLEKNLPAPAILYAGKLPEARIYVLIFQFLSKAVRLDTAFQQAASPTEHRRLQKILMACLARHHEQGLLQGDQHLGNFLLDNETLYSLDGDQVRTFSTPVPLKASITNLAAFLAVFPPEQDASIPDLFAYYCAQRKLRPANKTLGWVANRTQRIRLRRLKQYLRKIFTSRDPFVAEKTPQRFCVYDQRVWRPEYIPFKDAPQSFFPDSEHSLRPQDVLLHTVHGPVRLQKTQSGPGPLASLNDPLSRQWKQQHTDIRLGRSRAHPIMFLKIRTGCFRTCSFLLSEQSFSCRETSAASITL